MSALSTFNTLTLTQAELIIDGALAKAASLSLNPMTVAVFNADGGLVAFKKQDGSSMLRQDITCVLFVDPRRRHLIPHSMPQAIASGKALGALGMGMDSSKLAKATTNSKSLRVAAHFRCQHSAVNDT